MNRSLLASFTPQIMIGASRCGLDARSLQHVLRARGSRAASLRAGTARLSPREAHSLVAETGRSIGELALLGIEALATPEKRAANKALLRDTMKLMRMYAQLEPSRQPVRRKPARRVRDTAA